jgi:hypothetical protein
MRVAVLICSAVVAVLASTVIATASAERASMGRLSGSTKIYEGCPVDGGSCQPWHLYPHAQFTIARLTAKGAAVPGSGRIVESNADGRFRVSLVAGSYLVKPKADSTARGGDSLRVRVEADATRRLTVRYVARRQPS